MQFLQFMIRTPYPINSISIAFPGRLECEISLFRDYSSSGLFEILCQVTVRLAAFDRSVILVQILSFCSFWTHALLFPFSWIYSHHLILHCLSSAFYIRQLLQAHHCSHLVHWTVFWWDIHFITNNSTQASTCWYWIWDFYQEGSMIHI